MLSLCLNVMELALINDADADWFISSVLFRAKAQKHGSFLKTAGMFGVVVYSPSKVTLIENTTLAQFFRHHGSTLGQHCDDMVIPVSVIQFCLNIPRTFYTFLL